MHWPSPFARSPELMPKNGDKIKTGDSDYVDTWKAMEALVKKGKAKAIGVSNFSQKELERLLSETETVPAVHQMVCFRSSLCLVHAYEENRNCIRICSRRSLWHGIRRRGFM